MKLFPHPPTEQALLWIGIVAETHKSYKSESQGGGGFQERCSASFVPPIGVDVLYSLSNRRAIKLPVPFPASDLPYASRIDNYHRDQEIPRLLLRAHYEQPMIRALFDHISCPPPYQVEYASAARGILLSYFFTPTPRSPHE